jgi:hypothetical protein
MTLTGVMNTEEVPALAIALTLKPLAGTGTTRLLLPVMMKLVGAVAALVALGNTSDGVVGLAGGGGSGAMTTHTDVVLT